LAVWCASVPSTAAFAVASVTSPARSFVASSVSFSRRASTGTVALAAPPGATVAASPISCAANAVPKLSALPRASMLPPTPPGSIRSVPEARSAPPSVCAKRAGSSGAASARRGAVSVNSSLSPTDPALPVATRCALPAVTSMLASASERRVAVPRAVAASVTPASRLPGAMSTAAVVCHSGSSTPLALTVPLSAPAGHAPKREGSKRCAASVTSNARGASSASRPEPVTTPPIASARRRATSSRRSA
jgi:hypothetical protein